MSCPGSQGHTGFNPGPLNHSPVVSAHPAGASPTETSVKVSEALNVALRPVWACLLGSGWGEMGLHGDQSTWPHSRTRAKKTEAPTLSLCLQPLGA